MWSSEKQGLQSLSTGGDISEEHESKDIEENLKNLSKIFVQNILAHLAYILEFQTSSDADFLTFPWKSCFFLTIC